MARQVSPESVESQGQPASSTGNHPHLTPIQVQEKLNELRTASGQRKSDLMTELAWRPAWAIRSRRGTLQVLKSIFRNLFAPKVDH